MQATKKKQKNTAIIYQTEITPTFDHNKPILHSLKLDIASLTSDLPTLLGVTTGIAVLAGLICMVLHLFSKYPRHRNFGDAHLQPPIMYSTDTGKQAIEFILKCWTLCPWQIQFIKCILLSLVLFILI